MRTPIRLPLALAAIAALGAAALLASQLLSPSSTRLQSLVAAAAEADQLDYTLQSTQSTQSADATREIVERPLFFPSRRPLPPEPPAPVEAKVEPPPVLDFVLVGTVLTGQSTIALIKSDKAGPLQVGVGQDVGRWTVASIAADRIVVRNGAVEQLVGLRDFTSHAAPRATATDVRSTPAAASAAPAPPPPNSAIRRAGTRR